MRILITGGFGFLGGRLGQYMSASTEHEVCLASRSSEAAPWLPGARVAQVDWQSDGALEALCEGVDVVAHLAGLNAQDCAADPVLAYEFNAAATARLVRAASRSRVRRLLYLSSAHVYGSPLHGTITETSCAMPVHPYATSHRSGEDAVRTAHLGREIEGISVRLSNAFGAPAHPAVNCWMLLTNDLCRQAVEHGGMVLQSSGMQRRDFVPIEYVCGALTHLLEAPSEQISDGLFNIGGSWAPTVLEMAQRIAGRVKIAMGSEPDIQRKLDPNASATLDLNYRCEKFSALGFQTNPKDLIDKELDTLIRFCLDHYRNHER